MPRTSAADPKMVDVAVKAMKKHPTISVREAMLIAGFSPDDSINKTVQRNILRRLPGQGKRKFAVLQSLQPTPSAAATNDSISPLTDPTIPEQDFIAAQPPPPPKRARSRLNSQQKQNERVSNLLDKADEKAAHKAATVMYSEEREKGESGMSIRKVARKIKSLFGRGPSIATIHKYVVKDKLIGVSPLKKGPDGNISALVYKALCVAFGSKVRITQLNIGRSSTREDQICWLIKMFNYNTKQASNLWERVVRDSAIDMVAGKAKSTEERRVKWTTHYNLDLWFSSWEKALDDFGFFEYDAFNNRVIPPNRLRCILNFDETALSLDGSTITRGGRPPVVYEDPRLPRVGNPTSKSSQTVTMINGSNAFGEALPPHFQFICSAQTNEGKQIRDESALYMKRIIGQFGCDKQMSMPVSIGSNEKGGMDNEEFATYLRTSIMPLYPTAAPEKGKWIILKCDSGPGRMNIELLAELRLAGFILFPGVPNTTAVTQETDQNYGSFKGAYARNLDQLVEERIRHNMTTSIPVFIVGLIVFGGQDPHTKSVITRNAFEDGFSRELCRQCWEKVGAAPLTKRCLNDKLVRKLVGDGDDEYDHLVKIISEANILSTHTLTECGFDGSIFKEEISALNERRENQNITEENTVARRLALMDATTHGKKFTLTGGLHLTSDDIFISAEMSTRQKEKERLGKLKKQRQLQAVIKEKATLLLQEKGSNDNPKWTGADLNTLLGWYKIPNLTKMSKKEKMTKWNQICADNIQPLVYDEWTDIDETALLEASRTDIEMGDTAVGRLERQRMEDFKRISPKFTSKQWAEMETVRSHNSSGNGDSTTLGVNNGDGDEGAV